MHRRSLFFGLIIALVLAVSACGGGGILGPTATPAPTPTPECTAEVVQAFLDELEPLLGRWDDRAKIAGSTARINLSPVVTDLQDIKQDVEEIDAPWCAEETQEKAVTYMEQVIDAYLAFMAEEPDTTVDSKFEEANRLLNEFKTARNVLTINYLE